MTPPGDNEKRIDRDGTVLISGECAAGDGAVREGEPFVIRHHPTEPGGIFHLRCRPMSTGWYSLDDGEGDE